MKLWISCQSLDFIQCYICRTGDCFLRFPLLCRWSYAQKVDITSASLDNIIELVWLTKIVYSFSLILTILAGVFVTWKFNA